MVGMVVLSGASIWAAVALLDQGFTRRADAGNGAMTSSLLLNAAQETQRLQARLDERRRSLDAALVLLLAAVPSSAPAMAPLPALERLCGKVTLPPGVKRAGVVDGETGDLVALVETGDKGCVDRLWNLQVQALTGPPFPLPVEVERLAQSALYGMSHVEDGRTTVVGVHREGVFAQLRLARGDGGRAAFMDFSVAELEVPISARGVRLDSFVTVGGVVAGYIHGGPGAGMVPAAVKRIKAGENHALELPDVVEAAASRAVLAWLFPDESDDGDLALAGHQVPLDASLGVPVMLCTVASAPWPVANGRTPWLLWLLVLLAAVAQVAWLVLVTRGLSRALWSTAQRVRKSWMVSHEDEHLPSDEERAAQLLDAMTDGTRDTVQAAFGKGDRYWGKGPLQRLLERLRGNKD
jgi:hypothetical protein